VTLHKNSIFRPPLNKTNPDLYFKFLTLPNTIPGRKKKGRRRKLENMVPTCHPDMKSPPDPVNHSKQISINKQKLIPFPDLVARCSTCLPPSSPLIFLFKTLPSPLLSHLTSSPLLSFQFPKEKKSQIRPTWNNVSPNHASAEG
jgi:hypothetical protein